MTVRRGAVAAAIAVLIALAADAAGQGPGSLEVDAPAAILGGIPFDVTLTVPSAFQGIAYEVRTAGGERLGFGTLEAGENVVAELEVDDRADLPLSIAAGTATTSIAPRFLPAWVSLLPPLFAIVLALVFREVVVSLFAGVWLGALFVAGLNPLAATLTALDRFVLGALAGDADRVAIVMFSLLLGGMVGVVTRSGGTRGIVEVMRPYATSARRGQLMTWLAGLVIFFDDYANTLIVGNTMRPVTDRLRVSREKLAYIVDSTAAPMAAIAVITTWVGFEISLIGAALESAISQTSDPTVQANLAAGAGNPFSVFLHSIPFLFYPILALAFVLMVAVTRRDFGPMLAAERRAARGLLWRPGATPLADPSAGESLAEDDRHRWYNALVPVASVVIVAMAGIVYSGLESLGPGPHPAWDIVGAGDPFSALLWASFTGCVVAIAMPLAQRRIALKDAIEAWMTGMRSMLLAIVILTLAWGLGGVTEALGTGNYLADLLRDSLPIRLLPALVFLVAAATSFATGTSWGTMAILFPVVIPLAVAMGAGVGFDGGEHYTILLGAISSIMAGSIFGDHCSPISDTTVMSSMASGCDHIDHVRTQLPYAVVVGVVAMLVGDVATAFGLNPFVALVIGATTLFAVLSVVGRRVGGEVEPIPESEGEIALEIGTR